MEFPGLPPGDRKRPRGLVPRAGGAGATGQDAALCSASLLVRFLCGAAAGSAPSPWDPGDACVPGVRDSFCWPGVLQALRKASPALDLRSFVPDSYRASAGASRAPRLVLLCVLTPKVSCLCSGGSLAPPDGQCLCPHGSTRCGSCSCWAVNLAEVPTFLRRPVFYKGKVREVFVCIDC